VPTYEYACTACGHRLEAVQSFSDDPLTSCPECGEALRKVYGAVGIVLKGSGFYKTDSRAAANGKSSNGKSRDGASRDSGSGGTDTGSSEKSGAAAGRASDKMDSGGRSSGGSGSGDGGSGDGGSGNRGGTAKPAAAATS
jgi:putative FmdB family regulatory protein